MGAGGWGGVVRSGVDWNAPHGGYGPSMDHPDLLAARAFLEALTPDRHLVIYADFDADGLAAAAVLCRGLEARGLPSPTVHCKQRHAPAWSDAARAAVAALAPDVLVLTDLGVQAEDFLPGVPTLYLDHHVPSGRPGPPSVVCVADTWDPVPCSAWLAYDLVRPWLDADAPALWVAGVGVLSDLGDKAPWPYMAELRSRYRITHVREAVTLCNAARRASRAMPEVPLEVLRTGEVPKAMTQGAAGEGLAAARAEVKQALALARRQPPRFASAEPWAMVPVHSACQVHPLIAQQWASRLPKHHVISPNPDYLPDAVAFSIRSRVPGVHLPSMLRDLPFAADHPNTFGHGHAQASGGQLPREVFARFLEALQLPALG